MTDSRREGAPESAKAPEHPHALSSSLASPSLADRVVLALVLLATFALCIYPMMDTDFWWHLRTGQLIWEQGTVPRTDPFLFSESNHDWIDLQWGYELVITALYSLGGVNLVIFAKAVAVTATVAIGWFAAGRELPAWLKAVVWIPAIICITGRSNERPEIFSQLFLALWLWIACHAEEQPKSIWLLPVIQVCWINCHALFVLGLVVGGCYAVDYTLRKLAGGHLGLTPVSQELKPGAVFGAGAACALAAFLNPYGLKGALFPLVLYRKFSVEQEFYSSQIGEFQQPWVFFLTLKRGYENIYLDAEIALLLMAFYSLILLFVIHRRWSPFRWLLLLGFTHLAWKASRNVNIFALTAVVVLVANLADLWRLTAVKFQPEKDTGRKRNRNASGDTGDMHWYLHFSSPFARRAGTVGVLGIYSVWIAFIVSGLWGLTLGERKIFGWGERPAWFAHEAIQFAGQPGFPDRAILQHIGLAGVYEFHHGPEKKVFMDPRLEVVSQQTFRLQLQMLHSIARGDRSWESLVRDKDGNLPVIIFDSRNSRPYINGLLLTPGWRLVYADPSAAVFLTDRQADALNLPPVDPTPLMYPPR